MRFSDEGLIDVFLLSFKLFICHPQVHDVWTEGQFWSCSTLFKLFFSSIGKSTFSLHFRLRSSPAMIFSPMVLRVLASVKQVMFFPRREISFLEQSKRPFRLAVDGVSGIPSSQISISSFSRLL